MDSLAASTDSGDALAEVGGARRYAPVVILVDAHGLTIRRPGKDLFDDVTVTISSGDRIGLVGLNLSLIHI